MRIDSTNNPKTLKVDDGGNIEITVAWGSAFRIAIAMIVVFIATMSVGGFCYAVMTVQ